MCFLISIFLCFALVPKLVPRTVDFHWYWYRILKFWYRDNTTLNYTVMLNGYSQWLNIKGEKQFYRDISSIDISDAGLQS